MWLHLTDRCALCCSQELNSRACTFPDFSQDMGAGVKSTLNKFAGDTEQEDAVVLPGEMRNVVE